MLRLQLDQFRHVAVGWRMACYLQSVACYWVSACCALGVALGRPPEPFLRVVAKWQSMRHVDWIDVVINRGLQIYETVVFRKTAVVVACAGFRGRLTKPVVSRRALPELIFQSFCQEGVGVADR